MTSWRRSRWAEWRLGVALMSATVSGDRARSRDVKTENRYQAVVTWA